MNKKFILGLAVSFSLMMTGCSGSSEINNDSSNSDSQEVVNVTEQQKPKLMVIPSDQL
mgnify:CR=1 FL=1